jgi:hypothetical protein
MLNWNDKPLEELDFSECIEFEKSLLKKVLGANRSGMSESIINQLNVYLDLVRQYKKEAMHRELDAMNKKNPDHEEKGPNGVSVDLGLDE